MEADPNPGTEARPKSAPEAETQPKAGPAVREKQAFILGRRSVRVYAPGEVNEEAVTTMLEAAMAAPSAVDRDPWRFVVVRDQQTRTELANSLTNGHVLLDASLAIVVCGDLEAVYDRHLSYLLQDCAASIENLLLSAHNLGLGTCWLAVHPDEMKVKRVREILGLPPSVVPVACVPVGHPCSRHRPRTRFNPAHVHFEKW